MAKANEEVRWIVSTTSLDGEYEHVQAFRTDEDAYQHVFAPLLEESYAKAADADERFTVFAMLSGERYSTLLKAIMNGGAPLAKELLGTCSVRAVSVRNVDRERRKAFAYNVKCLLSCVKSEPGRCGYCGGRIVEGDTAHPGYSGWPYCEECKAT